MNQSSGDEGHLSESSAGLAALRQAGGKMYLTVSLLIGHQYLQDTLADYAPGQRWDADIIGTLRSHEESRDLARAIEPLFDDIADRKRGLFLEDFLIDTNSIDRADGYGPNICDIVDLEIPDRVSWSTEGRSLRAELNGPVRFENVLCRAFWVAHSNSSLSYHLSFEIPYEHSPRHYYALSLIQKVFFPTEDTDAMYKEDKKSPLVVSRRDLNPVTRPLHGYVRHRFQIDVVDLFTTALSAKQITPTRKLDGAHLTQALLTPGASLAQWRRKCVTVLEDPYFFRLLRQEARDLLVKVDPVESTPTDEDTLVYSWDDLNRCHPEHMAYYFLSGFFQNIIDFLRQDLAEVQDGTDPIYPPPGIQDNSSHYLVYATPSSLYEVVSQSRSLTAGRGWIGTCPYLFLVHLMTLHNEDLVDRYEQQVRKLIDHLEAEKLIGTGGQLRELPKNWRSYDTFVQFRSFRLTTFEEIHRHRYVNVLRYDTERAFYDSIEEVRGIRQREQYWANVVADLERTADDLRDIQQRTIDDHRNKQDDHRNRLLAVVAVVGLLQVGFQILDYFFDPDPTKIIWAGGLTMTTIILAVVVFLTWNQSKR